MRSRPLAVAAFLAACATALLVVYLRRFEYEVSGGPPVRLLTLVKTVERGAVLREDALATRDVPLAYVEDRAVRASERSKVLGLEARVTLEPQQTLLWSDLAITTEARELSALVLPGKRGVTVRAAGFDDTPGSALIHPGDYVDVIVTLSGPGQAREVTSAVLLQRVLVLAVGEQTGPAPVEALAHGGRPERPLTLSLSLAEAQRLALASERGQLSVALRNAADPAVQADVPEVRDSALFAPIAPLPPSAPRSGGPIALGGRR
jgi:pilus assembly protein CpaB